MPVTHARLLDFHSGRDAAEFMRDMGVDPYGSFLMSEKSGILPLYLPRVRGQAANLLKQEMLSLGGEAAVHRDVCAFRSRVSPVLLLGTRRHYHQLVQKLQLQPYGLKPVADEVSQLLSRTEKRSFRLVCGRKSLSLGGRTAVMGILNVTPDSFSDGGRYYRWEDAVSRGEAMAEEGAALIDIGGESTRPGSRPVPVQEELRRVLPVIERLRTRVKVPLSIDTTKAAVARAAFRAGATILNDTSALRDDPQMARTAAATGMAVILMHRRGTPRTMQRDPRYQDVMGEILDFFHERISAACQAGVRRDRLLVDPGIGFGKTTRHNLTILDRLSEIRGAGCPIVVGTSRKSLIGKVLGLPPEDRLEGTAATAAAAVLNGAHVLRVHDVRPMVRVALMADAIRGSRPE